MWDRQRMYTVHSFMCWTSARVKNLLTNLQKRIDMKKAIYLSAVFFIAVAAVIVSCSKSIEGRTDNAPALAPANIDLNAGTWKPVLLTSATEFAVPAPGATNTPD